MSNGIADYTKHHEGIYECRVDSHEMGEAFGDSVFQLNCTILGKIASDGRLDGFFGEEHITATFRLTTKMWWLFEKALAALAYSEDSLSPLGTEQGEKSTYFAGKAIRLQCKHAVNRDNTKKNEYWGLPDNRLARISDEKMSTLDAMFAAARQAPVAQGSVITDEDVPF